MLEQNNTPTRDIGKKFDILERGSEIEIPKHSYRMYENELPINTKIGDLRIFRYKNSFILAECINIEKRTEEVNNDKANENLKKSYASVGISTKDVDWDESTCIEKTYFKFRVIDNVVPCYDEKRNVMIYYTNETREKILEICEENFGNYGNIFLWMKLLEKIN